MTPQQKQIIDKCKEVFAKAKDHFPKLSFDHVDIRFDLKGRCAGIAGQRMGYYYMKFNADMLKREAFDHIINDTVPHEIAHIVCYMDRSLGHKHDAGWARVCRLLGGSGERTHDEEVVYGKGLTYEYTTTTGHVTRISQRIHTQLQRGQVRKFRERSKGELNQHCAHKVVGAGGQTLKSPVRAVPAKQLETHVTATENNDALARIIAARNAVAAARMPVAPVAKPAQPVVAAFAEGSSKASVSRAIMLSGYRGGKTYEEIINAMIAANGYNRQLARGTFKANAARVGIPADWGQ